MLKNNNFDRHKFISFIDEYLQLEFNECIDTATVREIYKAISKYIVLQISKSWRNNEKAKLDEKQAFYFSAEFLVGRAIYNNLISLNIMNEVSDALKEKGFDLNKLEEIEDMALGNGGLGRLAACFLDSAATQGYPLNGYGLRYKYGLFKQSFSKGFQVEDIDDWTKYGDPWSIRKEREKLIVEFYDQTVRAIPYDIPIIGYGNTSVNTLRLWEAEPLEEFDFELFNNQEYDLAVKEKNLAEDISRVLYPNDNDDRGKTLRIKQQYFFCSASIQDIIRKHVSKFGEKFDDFHEKYSIQLNDTHPTVAIPELIRILVDLYDQEFEVALDIARKTFSYTNHTVMAEALETWDCRLYKSVLPRIYEIVERINDNLIEAYSRNELAHLGDIEEYKIIRDKKIQMANLAIYGSNVINGVAEIHSEILKRSVLKQWYDIRPDAFQNKTNGITQRRWLLLCNPQYAELISNLLETEDWITDLSLLKGLERVAEKNEVLNEFIRIKKCNKEKLCNYIEEKEGIKISADFIFDIQIKRLHEYKRQLLNAFSILDIYYGIKDGRIKEFTPTVFIFGAKAAPGYERAKGIIKYINEISKLINNDLDMKDKLKVVFIQNYNVSYAEKLVCAGDVSEQISTAGTEASGTGNMKFMLNGTVTLGTFDGANIEIVREAGLENNYIFGSRVQDIEKIKDNYEPLKIYNENIRAKKVIDTLVEGTFSDDGTGIFKELYDSILYGAEWHKADAYYLLLDFESYVEAKLKVNKEYKNTYDFAKKSLINTANAGMFSSDRTIKEYAEEIWDIKKQNKLY